MMKVLAVFYVLIDPVVFSVALKLLIYEVNLASVRKIKGNLCRVLPFATMNVAFYRHIFSEKGLCIEILTLGGFFTGLNLYLVEN